MKQGGVVLGPTVFGYYPAFTAKLFPPEGISTLETLSIFGFMLFMFVIGVKIDPTIVLKSGKLALAIGLLGFFVPYVLGSLTVYILDRSMSLDRSMASVLPMVVTMHSVSAFPVIACFLADLKLLNSEIGRIASSASLVCDMCLWFIMIVKYAVNIASIRSINTAMGSLLSAVLLTGLIIFGIRPAALWAIRQTPEGKPVKEVYIFVVLVTLLSCGFLGEFIGLSAIIPPFILGLSIPDGPPLGAALVEKLDCFVSVLLMPIFFTLCGLKTNLFAISRWQNVGIIQFVVFVGFLGKTLGTMLPPLFCRMPIRDALSLALIMNSKGVVELVMLRVWRGENVISEEYFTMMIISVVVVTGVVSPLVKSLYDPSRRFLAYKRRTIRHHQPHQELRVLACIHSQENCRMMITLLDASNPTEDDPICLYVLHLIKLAGRASSLLIAHMPRENSNQNPTQSDRIFNAFRRFEQQKQGNLTIQCYKGISPYSTMHNDVCSLALEHRVTFIIIPFYKRFLYGKIIETSHVYRHLSRNVLDKAPCSVGVLIDRGNWRQAQPSSENQTSWFRVGVLFFGGADDREALAYGARMSDHPYVLLTCAHFSTSSGIAGGTERSRMLDSEIIDEYKSKAHNNQRVSYTREEVKEATDVVTVVRSLEGVYDLVMVGRRHAESKVMNELKRWNDNGHLGTVGEILATTNFKNGPSNLIVQQQSKVWGVRDPEETDSSIHLARVRL